MRGGLVGVVLAGAVGCSGTVSSPCPAWIDGPGGETVSPIAGDPPGTVLLSRFGPFEEARWISAVSVQVKPDACPVPASLAVGAWATDTALPSGDPHFHLAAVDVAIEGGGMGLATLPGEVEIPAGSFAWVARDLDGSCNAVGPEVDGVESLLWRPSGDGWQAIGGAALLSPAECGEVGQ